MRETKRAYKYRISPTDEQKRILAQTFGCCRFVYNWGLGTRKTAYFQHGQSLTYNDRDINAAKNILADLGVCLWRRCKTRSGWQSPAKQESSLARTRSLRPLGVGRCHF